MKFFEKEAESKKSEPTLVKDMATSALYGGIASGTAVAIGVNSLKNKIDKGVKLSKEVPPETVQQIRAMKKGPLLAGAGIVGGLYGAPLFAIGGAAKHGLKKLHNKEK